jgi:trans-aconitate methyltransferase
VREAVVVPGEQRRYGADTDEPVPRVDATKPHPARIYDYWLGGKDNFTVDREVAQQVIEVFPGIIPGVRAQRAFLGRAVRYLVGEAGITQFLDIGTGLPAAGNTHEVAQKAAPQSRIVYVDNDPMVLAHARALLISTREGACAYIDADLRDVDMILYEAKATLDFSRPVGIVLLGVIQFIDDREDPHAIIGRLLEAVPSGSYLVLGQPAADVYSEKMTEAQARFRRQVGGPAVVRTHTQVLSFFDGLEMIEPGVVQLPQWRPDPGDEPYTDPVPFWCGVGRKP